MALAPDGGLYILGTTESFGPGLSDLYLVRTDNRGIELWSKAYGGANIDSGRALIATSDGGLLMVGTTFSFSKGISDIYAVKVNPDGDTLWTRNYGSSNADIGSAVIEVAGGYLIAGSTEGFGATSKDYYAVMIDHNGEVVWQRNYPGGKEDICSDIAPTREGYLMSGTNPDGPTIYLVRLDSAGKILTGRSVFNPKGSARAGFMVNDTSFVFFGFSRISVGAEDSLLIHKTNFAGDRNLFPAIRNFGGGGSRANDGIQSRDGGFVALGSSEGFGRGADLFVVKTNSDGILEWARAYGGERDDEGNAILQTPDGGYVLVGTTRSGVNGTNGSDILLLKTNANGELVE